MLRSVQEIKNYVLQADDGEIGRCKDFLFDDNFWTIHYMVADTGKWLPGQKVIVSPISLGEPDWNSRFLPVRLTKKQIEDAPAIDEDAPVSRQYEATWTQYYGWPNYWVGVHPWGELVTPELLYDRKIPEDQISETDSGDEPLRSMDEVRGYYIEAADGEIGHVEDFIVDDETWDIHYMAIHTSNWLPGKKVLVAPEWLESINWVERKMAVDLTREQIKKSPEYDHSTPINREFEEQLYDFYGRPGYWK